MLLYTSLLDIPEDLLLIIIDEIDNRSPIYLDRRLFFFAKFLIFFIFLDKLTLKLNDFFDLQGTAYIDIKSIYAVP